MSFPVRFGGLAILILAHSANAEFVTSAKVTKPLVELLIAPERLQPVSDGKSSTVLDAVGSVCQLAREARSTRNKSVAERVLEIKNDVTDGQRFLFEIASEKGVSSWFTASLHW